MCPVREKKSASGVGMATAQLLLRRVSSAFSTTTPSRSPLLRRSPVSSPRFQHRASMASSASAAAPLQKVQIQREDTTFDAYIVGKENAPGIVVLQEWWGVDYEIKNHATRISQIGGGYRALIPDLYRGKVALDVAEAQHLMEGLDWQGAIKDIHASVNWLKANGSPKVGVTGYCLGGALSIACGVLVPEVDAVVAFYGTPSSELADPSKAKAPIQAHFGELDSFVGFSDVTTISRRLQHLVYAPPFWLSLPEKTTTGQKLKTTSKCFQHLLYAPPFRLSPPAKTTTGQTPLVV